jgi:hypothetical protein
MKARPSTEATRLFVFVVLGAAVAWIIARWFWPWCGPLLLHPCPIATRAGEAIALLIGAVWGATKAYELELAERRWRRGVGP